MSELFETISDAISATVETVARSVVQVDGRKRMPASGWVWSSAGLIVTANHVLERDDQILIRPSEGDERAAELVGRDPTSDLAVLRVDPSGLEAARPGSGSPRKVGQLVVALARPGKSIQASLGMISTLGGAWRTHTGGKIDEYYYTGVDMLPGFSGGPLINARGEILGLNTSALMREQAVTIPFSTLERVIGDISAHGRVRRGYLGVGTQPVRLPETHASQFDQETGLLVTSVEPGSPADRGGILLGDILVRLGEDPLRFPDDLIAGLGSDRIGSQIAMQVVRGGQPSTLQITLGERP